MRNRVEIVSVTMKKKKKKKNDTILAIAVKWP